VSSAFIDTNIFYNILFETSLTQMARKLLEEFEDRKFYTSLTVVNELLYIPQGNIIKLLEKLEGLIVYED